MSRTIRITEVVTGLLLLLATAGAWVWPRTIGWTQYTPTTTRVIELPLWPVVVALAIVLAALAAWDLSHPRTAT